MGVSGSWPYGGCNYMSIICIKIQWTVHQKYVHLVACKLYINLKNVIGLIADDSQRQNQWSKR